MPPAATPHRGGETIALKSLFDITSNKTYTATFEKPKTAPTAFDPQSTTLLSPHLHFGSLSCREFYWRVQDIVSAYKNGQASQPPTSLTGQLLFRDMYFGAQAALGYSFAQTFTNSHCRFIPWHLPSCTSPDTNLTTGHYSIDNPLAESWFKRWKAGTTGFPWIDALMRQLRTEGWIHHLGRHAVACFLTRGGCYVDWERGAEVFEEWLIDHETACNAGNWQWLSCTAFFSQFYRCYSPTAFPAKWDREGEFVRRYVPELREFDKKFIYEPWKAPIADQKRWGCRVEGDGSVKEKDGLKYYPKPMFDFAERRRICIDAIKKAYDVRLYGNDKRVLDGTWRELFDNEGEGSARGKQGAPGVKAGGVNNPDVDVTGKEEHEDGGEAEGSEEQRLSGTQGRKRSAGQRTLDGMVKRTKK
jgi:cryptochrome